MEDGKVATVYPVDLRGRIEVGKEIWVKMKKGGGRCDVASKDVLSFVRALVYKSSASQFKQEGAARGQLIRANRDVTGMTLMRSAQAVPLG